MEELKEELKERRIEGRIEGSKIKKERRRGMKVDEEEDKKEGS